MPVRDDELKEGDDRCDATVLMLLLDPHEQAPLSVEEIVRSVGDSLSVHDSLARLHAAGLIHRNADCCFPTRAARRFAELGVLTW